MTKLARLAAALVLATGLTPAHALDLGSMSEAERTAYLKIPFNWVYAIYLAFAVGAIIRYLWLGFSALRGKAPEAFDPTKAGSGV